MKKSKQEKTNEIKITRKKERTNKIFNTILIMKIDDEIVEIEDTAVQNFSVREK